MNTIIKLILVLSTIIIFTSCENNLLSNQITNNKSTDSKINASGKKLVLGDKINDPYEINNINAANISLRSSSTNTLDTITANMIYLRFLPYNEEELDILKSDTDLILFDYPLNYEIAEVGDYYHDPTLPESAITWQYSVVPVNYSIPKIKHEVIYKVYIPSDDENSEVQSKSNFIGTDYLDDLITKSYQLTGNLEQEASKQRGWFSPSRWTPSGKIEVYDDNLKSYIPLKGAEVHARWSTHIKTDITDSNGNFSMGHFIYKVNYSIKWERGLYDIRNGSIAQAWYNKPGGRVKGSWNLKIGTGGKSIMYATIHRAAHKHFYGDNLGINRPTLRDDGKTKICYIDEPGSGVFWGDWSSSGILPDIKIWGKNEAWSYRKTNEVFGTTAHELGHQAHSRFIGNIKFWQTSKSIYESWAEAVEWALTNDEYHDLGDLDYFHTGNYHDTWPNVDEDAIDYTPIFIDLMDDVNQGDHSWSTRPNDVISGYSLKYIQDNILSGSYGLSSLKSNIKSHKIAGVTDAQIETLFLLY